jgi:hypothetical protein
MRWPVKSKMNPSCFTDRARPPHSFACSKILKLKNLFKTRQAGAQNNNQQIPFLLQSDIFILT